MEAQRRVERLCAMGRAHLLGGLGQVSRNGNGTHTHTVGTHTPHTYMCSHTHTHTRTHTHTHTHVPTPTRMNARMNAQGGVLRYIRAGKCEADETCSGFTPCPIFHEAHRRCAGRGWGRPE
jgi:hypothetical protein